MGQRAVVIVAFMAIVASFARSASAQAWVPFKGEGSVSILFQDLFVADHFFDRGQRADRGEIRTNSLMVDVTYGLSDRVSVTAAVPFIRAKYTGRSPHPTAQDDGSAHAGFQDLRLGVRYNLARGPIVITPFVSANLPTHDYEYFAHASYGPQVREVDVGTYAARVLAPALPNAFVQARYSYTFAQKIVGIDHNRSNLDVEFGYFLTPTLRVFTLGTGHKTHGGIDVTEAGWRALPVDQGPHHDRIGRIDLLDVGGGVQFSLTRSLDVFGSYIKSLAGRNTHALDRAVTIGASWSFGHSLRALMLSDSTTPRKAGGRQLAKCLCQK